MVAAAIKAILFLRHRKQNGTLSLRITQTLYLPHKNLICVQAFHLYPHNHMCTRSVTQLYQGNNANSNYLEDWRGCCLL
jgi:hypothetical protein